MITVEIYSLDANGNQFKPESQVNSCNKIAFRVDENETWENLLSFIFIERPDILWKKSVALGSILQSLKNDGPIGQQKIVWWNNMEISADIFKGLIKIKHEEKSIH